MSELGLWATVVALAGITAVLLIGQARRRPGQERDGSRQVPTDGVWLRPGEVAHTIHSVGPEAATAVVLSPTTLIDLLVDRPSVAAARIRRGLEGLGLAGLDADRVVDAIAGLLDRPVTGLVLQAWDEQPSVQDACARDPRRPRRHGVRGRHGAHPAQRAAHTSTSPPQIGPRWSSSWSSRWR